MVQQDFFSASIDDAAEDGGLDISMEDEGKTLWSSILAQVQRNCRLNLPSRKTIIVLGDNGVGKTSLAARLQRNEDPKESKGLEFHYMDVKDENRDETTRMSIWILDGDAYHSNLLKFALTEENIADAMVLLVGSLSEPWKVLESLHQWMEILNKHVNRLKISPNDMEELKASLVRHFQSYTPPSADSAEAGSAAAPSSSSSRSRNTVNALHPPASSDPEKVLLPLAEGVFSRNCGLPLLVVMTKSDCINSVLERELGYQEEQLDFIQMHLRRFCLERGAALFYLSVKEDKNCELFSRYLQHRIYGFPFSAAAYVVEKDSVFVPAGWDNAKKIGILTENMVKTAPDANFYEVVVRPAAPRKSGREQREAEAVAEDEQVFLMRQQTAIQRSAPLMEAAAASAAGASGKEEMRGPAAGRQAAKPQAGGPGGAPGAAPGQEGVLANFFNSLLSKKPAGGGQQGGSPAASPGSGPPSRQTSRQSPSNGSKSPQSPQPASRPAGPGGRSAGQRQGGGRLQQKNPSPAASPKTAGTPAEETKPAAEEKPAGSPAAEEKTAGSPAAEEKPVESPVAEEKLAESPVAEEKSAVSAAAEEKPVEEPAAEEKPAESPAAEEKPVESPAVEEKLAESPAAEEKPVESPAAEEKPVESPAAEEKLAESSAAEEKPTESPAAEEKPVESPAAEEKPVESPTAEEKPAESPAEDGSAAEAEEKPAASPEAEEEKPVVEDKATDDAPSETPAEEKSEEAAAADDETQAAKTDEEAPAS